MGVKCDFFTVSPHGAGLQSFLYGLHLLGLPCSPWWKLSSEGNLDAAISYIQAAKSSSTFSSRAGIAVTAKSSSRPPLYAGITIDRACYLNSKIETTQPNNTPVFWLVRDPVLLLCSNINRAIGELLIENLTIDSTGFNNLPLFTTIKNTITECLIENTELYISYVQQLNTLASTDINKEFEVIPFDTTDINSTCIDVIGRYFEIFRSNYIESQFDIAHNSFENWIQGRMPPILILDGCPVYVCEAELSQFRCEMFPHLSDQIWPSIGNLTRNGKKYSLYVKKKSDYNYYVNDSSIPLSKYQEELINSVAVFESKNKLLVENYSRIKMTPEDLLIYLKENTICFESFCRQATYQMEFFQKNCPGIADRWTHSRSFLSA